MIESRQHKPYWRHTKWQLFVALAPFLTLIIGLPLFADALNRYYFLGFPLGYLLACHGVILASIVTIAIFIKRQDAIDRWHGAHEDL